MNESQPRPGDDGTSRLEPLGTPSGYVCPTCGGALWERRDGTDPAFQCRIGHAFEALELWVSHCAARNGALRHAARALAENAALARKLATWARQRGDPTAAARIAEEAELEELYYEQVRRMLEDLAPSAPEPA